MEPTYKSVGHGGYEGWEGMEPVDLRCSRNAHDQNVLVRRAQEEINQPPSLKREQASLEGSFIWTRAVEPKPSSLLGMTKRKNDMREVL
jgi:hypothetical protein